MKKGLWDNASWERIDCSSQVLQDLILNSNSTHGTNETEIET